MPVGVSLYNEQNTVVDRLDPRVKLFWVPVVFIIAMLINHPLYMFFLLLHILALAVIGRLPKATYKLISGAVIFCSIASLIFWPRNIDEGRTLFVFLGAAYTDIGLMYAIAMGMRVASMISASIVWLVTTSPQKLSLGLTKMGLPSKMGLGLSVVLRFIPYIISEFKTIAEAQMARGSDFTSGNKISQIRKYIPLFGPLFTRMFLLINTLAIALEARGFSINKPRTTLYDIKINSIDYVFAAFVTSMLLSTILLRINGLGRVVTYLL